VRHCITHPAMRAKPVDLVAEVRRQLDQTADEQRRGFLIGLAADLLRRRQTSPEKVGAGKKRFR
jgi:hypothetical protein